MFLAINISDSLGNQVGDVGSLVVNELVAAGADDPEIRPVGFAPAGVLVDVVGLQGFAGRDSLGQDAAEFAKSSAVPANQILVTGLAVFGFLAGLFWKPNRPAVQAGAFGPVGTERPDFKGRLKPLAAFWAGRDPAVVFSQYARGVEFHGVQFLASSLVATRAAGGTGRVAG